MEPPFEAVVVAEAVEVAKDMDLHCSFLYIIGS
jgi:hypothetical protein